MKLIVIYFIFIICSCGWQNITTVTSSRSEIMHLFIAREALDPHLRRGAAVFDSRKEFAVRAQTALIE